MLGQRLHNAPLVAAGAAALVVALACAAGPASAASASASHVKSQKGGGGNTTQPPLLYSQGKLLTASTTYAIWWGPTAKFPSDAQSGIETLLGGFGGSSYLGIAAQYMPGGVAPTSSFATSVFDTTTAPPTHSPSTATIAAEVAHFFPSPDKNAIYLVYTSNFPHLSFCAWHAAAVIGGVTTQIGYLPNTTGIAGCDPGNKFNLQNFSQGTRSLADSTAHEFMESVTDPVPVTGWADKNGQEIGDKCNFVYGSSPIDLGGQPWQIQEEWSNAANNNAGGCVDGS